MTEDFFEDELKDFDSSFDSFFAANLEDTYEVMLEDIKYLEKLVTSGLDNICDCRERQKAGYRMTDEDLCDEAVWNVCKDYANFLITYRRLYKLYSNVFAVANDAVRERIKEIEANSLVNGDWVSAKSEGEALYVRLPRVPVKYYRKSTLFQEELRLILNDLSAKQLMPIIPNKVVRILNVFKTKTHPMLVPDHDNYDLKRLLDVITDYCGGGDSGLTCSLFYETIMDNSLPEGTYFIVKPMTDAVESRSETVSKLRELFKSFFNI